MWFRKKEFIKQIEVYDKDVDRLKEFAKGTGKERLEDVNLDDIKAFYRHILANRTPFTAGSYMLAIRKFFRFYRRGNVLKADLITDDPLNIVEKTDRIIPMEKTVEKKKGPGRPRDIVSIKKVVALRNEGIAFRVIAKAIGKDVSQVYVWWRDKDLLLS